MLRFRQKSHRRLLWAVFFKNETTTSMDNGLVGTLDFSENTGAALAGQPSRSSSLDTASREAVQTCHSPALLIFTQLSALFLWALGRRSGLEMYRNGMYRDGGGCRLGRWGWRQIWGVIATGFVASGIAMPSLVAADWPVVTSNVELLASAWSPASYWPIGASNYQEEQLDATTRGDSQDEIPAGTAANPSEDLRLRVYAPEQVIRMTDFLPSESRSVAKRVYVLRFSPIGQRLAIRDGANEVWEYDLKGARARRISAANNDSKRIEDLLYSPSGDRLFAISASGNVGLQSWGLQDPDDSWRADIWGTSLAWAGPARLLVDGRNVYAIDRPESPPLLVQKSGLLRTPEGSISLLMSNLDGTAGESSLEWREKFPDGTVKVLRTPPLPEVWQILLQRRVGRSVGRQAAVDHVLKLSPDGNRLVILGEAGLLVWNASSNAGLIEMSSRQVDFGAVWVPLEGQISAATYAPNGQWLAVSVQNKTEQDGLVGEVHLIDAVAGQWLGRLGTLKHGVGAMAFSRDGQLFAMGSTSLVEDEVRVYDLDRWMTDSLEARTAAEAPGEIGARAPNLRGLASSDPVVAWASIQAVRGAPQDWQAELSGVFKQDPAQTASRLNQLVTALESPSFRERELALDALQTFGEREPAAVRALQDQPSLSSEGRFRIQSVLNSMSGVARPDHAEWLLYCRTLQALEGVPDDWAQEALAMAAAHPLRAIARQAKLSQDVWQAKHRRE
jgi:WD40 repeat protein